MLVQQVDESQSKKTVTAVNEEQAQAGLSPQPNDVFVDYGNCHALEQEVQNFVNVEEVTQELRDAADVRMNLPEDHMSLTLDGLQPDDSIDNTTGVRALVQRGPSACWCRSRTHGASHRQASNHSFSAAKAHGVVRRFGAYS